MSETWQRHMARVTGLLDDQNTRRAAWEANNPQPSPFTPAVALEAPSYGFEGWSGGNGMEPQSAPAMTSSGSPAGGTFGLGGFPNSTTLAQAMDINPAAARGLMTAAGLVSPGLGMGLSALNSFGNIANTVNNVDMLQGLGVNPGWGSMFGGALGFNNLAGNTTGALNKAMADMMPGFANMSVEQQPGEFAQGWADIAAGMDAANAAASGGGPASNPSGGQADRGDITAEPLGDPTQGFMMGGYTGAGDDGVVQPWKRAGVVHEGEFVVPAHMMRGMMRV